MKEELRNIVGSAIMCWIPADQAVDEILDLVRKSLPKPKQARFMESVGGESGLDHIDKFAQGWNKCLGEMEKLLKS